MTTDIAQRDALRHAGWILGGTISASTIFGALAGCDDGSKTAIPLTLSSLKKSGSVVCKG